MDCFRSDADGVDPFALEVEADGICVSASTLFRAVE